MKRMTKIVSMLALYIATFLQSFAQTDFFTQEKALSAADIAAGKIIAFKGISGTNSQWINWEKASTSTPVKAGLYEVEGAPSGTGVVLKRQIDNKYIGISAAITNNEGDITGYNIQMVESQDNAVVFTVGTPNLDEADVTGIHELSLPDMTGSMTGTQSTAEKQAVLQTSWAYGKQIRLTANIDGSDFYTNIQTGGTGIPRLAKGKGSWSVIMAYDAAGYTPIAFNGYYRIISGLQGFESTQGVKKAMYDAENGKYRWNTLDETLPQFIWDITMNDFGEMTIKNCYSEQYMSGMGTIGEEPAVVKFNDLGNSEFNLLINSQTMHAEGHSSGAGISGNIVSWAGGANSASSWKLEAVDQEIADEINSRYKNKVAFTSLAKEALNELQTNYSYTVDAEFNNALVNDASRITSNATEESEGAIENLVDGNAATYWHSCWQNGPAEQHYLQFDLGAGNEQEALAITYWKRFNAQSAFPTALTFMVSNDGTKWKTVKQIENLDTSAPTTENPGYTSKGFSLFGSYRYLRVLLYSNNYANGYPFTHFSEFRIHPVTANGGANSVIDQSLITEVLNKIDAGNNNDNISETDINNLRTAFNNYKIAAQKYNYTKLVDDLNSAGKLAEDPAIGQYKLTKANELKALCASTDATLDQIEAAYTAFHASLNAYVFTINSAYTGYPNGSSIYDNNSGTLYWKQTNKYDKSMLWKFEDATTNNITVGEYVVTNMATGNKFWDADFISVTASTAEGISNALTFRTNGTGSAIHAQQNNSEVVRYGDETSQASAWTFEYVGESKNIDAVDEQKLAEFGELSELITACEPFEGKIGTGLNQFTSENFETALSAAKDVAAKDIYTNPNLDITDTKNSLKAAKEALTINQPEPGKYYRIKSVAKNKYISSIPVNDSDNRPKLIDEADESTVYYLSADKRLTSAKAQNINKDSRPSATDLGTTFEFLINNNGYYLIKSTERNEPLYPHYDNGDLLSYDWQGGSYADKLVDAWILEEVTDEASLPKLTKTMTAEYATIAAPVALNIPSGVKAYTAKVNGDKATLTEISGNVIPAGVAAVIKKTGAESSYEFTFAPEGVSENESDLQGVYATYNVPTDTKAYVLANKEKGIGFYLLNAEDRTLAANKAYLVAPAEASGIKAFTFDFGGTTGIDNPETAVEAEEYYDLQGRRVMNPTKGIYVTKSGKKVLFTK